ncbi:MAG: hypothetical protein ACRD1I_03195 [Terriglobia bacterium]
MDPTSTVPVSNAEPRPPAPAGQAEHRRGTRLSVAVPVILAGKNAEGVKFREESRTLSINRTGATLETSHVIMPGAELLIKNPSLGITVQARAVRFTKRSTPGKLSLVAVELVDLKNVWGIQYPPQDWHRPRPAAARPEKLPAAASPVKVIEIDLNDSLPPSPPGSVELKPKFDPQGPVNRLEEKTTILLEIGESLANLAQTAAKFSASLERLLCRTQELSRRIREEARTSPKHTDQISAEEQIVAAAQDASKKFTGQFREAAGSIRRPARKR